MCLGVRVYALTLTCVRELSRHVSLLGQVVQSPARAIRAAGRPLKHEEHCHHTSTFLLEKLLSPCLEDIFGHD